MKKKIHLNRLYKILGIRDNGDVIKISKELKISKKLLEYYNDKRIVPDNTTLMKIQSHLGVEDSKLRIMLGVFDKELLEWLSDNSDIYLNCYSVNSDPIVEYTSDYQTELGTLFRADCIELMRSIKSDSIDMIFADPPFNLDKNYESEMDDNISDDDYIKWTEKWLLECVRILKPGGALFVYNLPKWLTETAVILNKHLEFRHWINLNYRGYTPPISKKLNITHYGMLYYTKGKPSVFNTQRIPMKTCRHCGGEIHDYGGKKKNVSKNGHVISELWEDIHPVRHKERKNRDANELSLKLLLRTISLASNEGDLIFDPFGGSGTTYKAAELLNRKWIGCEIGTLDFIIERLNNGVLDEKNYNEFINTSDILFTEKQRKLRLKNNFWLPEDFE